jgi:hypothetical protein
MKKGDKSVRKKHGKYPSLYWRGQMEKRLLLSPKKNVKKSGEYFWRHMWTCNGIVNGRSTIPS